MRHAGLELGAAVAVPVVLLVVAEGVLGVAGVAPLLRDRDPFAGFSRGLRLFTLGGSSALGFPWGADRAFTQLLGDALQPTYPERAVEAVNAGASGHLRRRGVTTTRSLRL